VEHGAQGKKARGGRAKGWELVIPNPKLKLMDQVREVLRVKHCDGEWPETEPTGE
jgi:hypothetical protein